MQWIFSWVQVNRIQFVYQSEQDAILWWLTVQVSWLTENRHSKEIRMLFYKTPFSICLVRLYFEIFTARFLFMSNNNCLAFELQIQGTTRTVSKQWWLKKLSLRSLSLLGINSFWLWASMSMPQTFLPSYFQKLFSEYTFRWRRAKFMCYWHFYIVWYLRCLPFYLFHWLGLIPMLILLSLLTLFRITIAFLLPSAWEQISQRRYIWNEK